ncbi:MAG: hypothetical protein RIC38_15830 [Chromatocurvus sp.]
MITHILDPFEKHPHFLRLSPGRLRWNMAERGGMLIPGDAPTQILAASKG